MQKFILHAGDDERMRVLANCCKWLGELPVTKSWEVTIKRYVKARTDPQNHALFGVAYPVLSAETGFTKDELHEAFCKRFFGTVDREVMGQMQSKPFRTTTTGADGRRDVISTEQFSDFYAMVQQVGSEAGVFVPDPDPLHGMPA
jgi:hypothetical protein